MTAAVTKAFPGAGTTDPGTGNWLSSDLPSDLLHAASRRRSCHPRFIRGELCCDHLADIYALGCVAYWLLTGSLVFDETDTKALLAAYAEREPLAPSDPLDEPLPGELDDIVVACLAKQPVKRPQTALELKRSLEGVTLSASWSDARAEAWWRDNLPSLLHEPQPGLDVPAQRPGAADGPGEPARAT